MLKESELAKDKLNIEASVIVVVYNQPLSLKLILRSLFAQTFKGDKEIVIADDGSNIELFSSIKDGFDKAGIPIKYIWQQDRGIRLAESRNNGIKIAKGKYLLLLDGDMVPDLNWISQHLETHKQPKLLVAGNRSWRGTINDSVFQVLENQPVEEVLQNLEHNWPVDKDSKRREATERERRLDWLNSPRPWRACFGGNLSVQKAPEVLFDENFTGWGNEDREFSYRLCNQYGYTPVYRDDISVYHLESPQSIGNIFRTARHEEIVSHMRNICYFFDKCSGLEPEEVFFGFSRFKLDEKTNKWKVIQRPPAFTLEQLQEKIRQVRRWLEENKIYPQ